MTVKAGERVWITDAAVSDSVESPPDDTRGGMTVTATHSDSDDIAVSGSGVVSADGTQIGSGTILARATDNAVIGVALNDSAAGAVVSIGAAPSPAELDLAKIEDRLAGFATRYPYDAVHADARWLTTRVRELQAEVDKLTRANVWANDCIETASKELEVVREDRDGWKRLADARRNDNIAATMIDVKVTV